MENRIIAIIDILESVINDFNTKWTSESEKRDGIFEYAVKIDALANNEQDGTTDNCNIPVVSNSVVKTCTLKFGGYMETCMQPCSDCSYYKATDC